MAKSHEGMIQRLETMLTKIHERMMRWQERANREGVNVMDMSLPNGTYPMDTLILAEAQTSLALVMLRGEIEEEEKPLEFHQMMHIYWSETGTTFCLSPDRLDHGFLGTRGYEAGQPDCPECHEKLVQFRSM